MRDLTCPMRSGKRMDSGCEWGYGWVVVMVVVGGLRKGLGNLGLGVRLEGNGEVGKLLVDEGE